MASRDQAIPQLRRTRIVCISDTHNQTPKLPKGDILIHAGDLTNQGSFTELKKTVDWLEKANFEAKIVIAGNHDITLDADFYKQHGSSWRWPRPQDPEQCRSLLIDSQSITFLENEAASIFLSAPTGPHTCFKVFGSPCTPKLWNWAFQYGSEDAAQLWDAIPSDTDIVVTHTPPRNHCDAAGTKERTGCEALLNVLSRVRPMLSIFGHIHEARGVERVQWNENSSDGCLEESVEVWKDSGIGNNKQSLVNLTLKGGRPLRTAATMTRHNSINFLSLTSSSPMGDLGVQPDVPQPGVLNSTSRPKGVPVFESEANGKIRRMLGGAIEYRQAPSRQSDIGFAAPFDVGAVERRAARKETCMINAAFLGPHFSGGPKQFNKPIVVDVDLPVWS
ncbi:Metallo-dependent phosphatase [Lindgomyces ingoldianus]|uniref:Metallo-dependent phosphatase n=1 Tax=Lindgomyces ingoldianus TaxID=673940 RepID=A0ACB6RCG3_9PLEO|nr:Metallo-dependent phosphatase [Lindgomyces ingoldianus]KAF2476949.1 Metallo-dependent phosphatase [Lindgomyces ingoldianus]